MSLEEDMQEDCRNHVRQLAAATTVGNTAKAKAIMDFVNQIAGAHESGFINRNYCSIAELYRTAQNHCKDELNIDVPCITVQWGDEAAKSFGLGDPNFN